MIKNFGGERVVWIPDIHVPYQDEKALHAALEFIHWFKPNHVFVLGDLVDFYQVSKFVRDPKRAVELQDNIDESIDVLARIKEASRDAKLYFEKGNHELRLEKFIWTHAPELDSLRSLKLDELMQFKKLGYTYHEQGWCIFKDLLIKHGNVVRINAGYSAFGELTKAGMSGVSGHTHRLGQTFVRNMGGFLTWIEAGCLCDLNPHYMEGLIANWEHGIAIGFFKKNSERFSVSPIPIIDGKLLFDLREFS